MSDYAAFLHAKSQHNTGSGFDPENLPDYLYGFQLDLVRWALQQGRAGIFADCGLGKTPMSLAWAHAMHLHTGKPVLYLTPLAVSFQAEQEAAKFAVPAGISRDGKIPAEVTITNYERLEHFDPESFGAVVCDESSVLKNFDGKRRALITEFLRTRPYRLLDTATAAPNDYTELGTSSEALGYLGHMDMLNRFFVNAQKNSATKYQPGRYRAHTPDPMGRQVWRFKGHAQEPFWQWVASWARAVRRPSDLGYPDDGFDLPELAYFQHVVQTELPAEGQLFSLPAVGLRDQREEQRRTLVERCEKVTDLLADAAHGIAWCHLNDEGTTLARMIPGAVEVAGAQSIEEKEERLSAFTRGEIRVLVTKPSVASFGLNWQHCHRMTYFPSHSYEQMYQAVRRCWRYGQTHDVRCDVVTTPGGAHVLKNLERKAAQADKMFDRLVAHMREGLSIDRGVNYTEKVQVPAWLTS